MKAIFAVFSMVCIIAGCGEADAQPSSIPSAPTAEVYALQYLTDFDCLDGVRFDRSNGTITLFGHRSDPSRFLHVAYFDYLAEALEHARSPTISLEPLTGFYAAVDSTINSVSDAVTHEVTRLFDKDAKLTESSAWFLQQVGLRVEPGLSHRETLARMLRVAGRDDIADMLQLMDEISSSPGNESQKATELFRLLGILSATEDVDRAFQMGKITSTQKADEFHQVFLRAIARQIGVDARKYSARYATYRQAGVSPEDAISRLQNEEIQDDVGALQAETFWQMLKVKQEILVPPWIGSTAAAEPPRLHPVYENLSPSSWLARTLFQADVALKSFVSLGPVAEPQLKALIPGFISQREFLRARGKLTESSGTTYQRAEIVPGAFEIAASPDGAAIRFLKTPMRIVVARLAIDDNGRRRDVRDSDLDQYAEQLSGRYDQLARVFPSLFKVREAAKIVAVARWLQARAIQISFPAEGRMSWKVPESFPAIVSPRLEVDVGRFHAAVNISGGVSLTPERSWKISTAPVEMPARNSIATAPKAPGLQARETDLRNRLQASTDPAARSALELQLAVVLLDRGDGRAAVQAVDRAARLNPSNTSLLILAAQSHFDGGDAAGAAQIMRRYLQTDPKNIPAQRMLARFQQQSTMPQPASAGEPAADRNQTKITGVPLAPFQWNGPVSRAVYAMEERAPELPDIHMAPFKYSALPPAPPVPDIIQLRPEIIALRQRRDQLITEYRDARPDRAPEIVKKIKQVDADVERRASDLAVSFESDSLPVTEPSKQPNGQDSNAKTPPEPVYILDDDKKN